MDAFAKSFEGKPLMHGKVELGRVRDARAEGTTVTAKLELTDAGLSFMRDFGATIAPEAPSVVSFAAIAPKAREALNALDKLGPPQWPGAASYVKRNEQPDPEPDVIVG